MDNTAINYPVVQTPGDPEYYLQRDFDGQFSPSGTPFADFRCRLAPEQGFNTVIYLHDRLMLELNQYTYLPNYLEGHRYIQFDTLTREGVYEVVAVFYADGGGARLLDPWNPDDPQAYDFYNYLEVDSLAGFRRYAEGVRARQLLRADADFSPRSHLLTLVCCAMWPFSGIDETGRLVVIAKRVGT